MFRTGEGSGGASLTFRHAFPAALTASSAVLPVDFNEKLFHRLVDYTTVCPAGRGVFTFRNGVEVSTEIYIDISVYDHIKYFFGHRNKSFNNKGSGH